MEKVKVSDILIQFLEGLGTKHVFTVSGGGSAHLLDSLGKSKKIQYICNHHEQASSMAAESYSRVSDMVGVCLVTFGPGATNAITGATGAWLDSIPTLYISGQVAMDHMMTGTKLRQMGVQEINIIDIVKPITKYAVTITEPTEALYHIEKAVYLARAGRPGPSWLDIPTNIQSAWVDPTELKHFDAEAEGLQSKPSTSQLQAQVAEVVRMLKESKRPLLFAGHGIRLAKARKEFEAVIRKLAIPVTTTMSAHDLLPTDDELYAGRPAIFGDRAGNIAAQTCDLLIAVGARMHLWNIGYNYKDFARNAKKVMVDIDPEELQKKSVVPNYPVVADAKDFLTELSKQLSEETLPDVSPWLKKCQEIKKKYPVIVPEYKDSKPYINSYYFIGELSKAMQEGEIIVTGVGSSFTGTLQSIQTKKNQSFNCNVGCAAMGYDLPAAIGASFAHNKKRVVLIVGDGGIMMNLQELQTIFHHQLPIKIFLLNNNGYLSIKNTQTNFYQKHYVASTPESGVSVPNFKKVSEAFGIPHISVTKSEDVDGAIQKTLDSEGPVMCEISMDPDQPLVPRLFAEIKADGTYDARPLEDMYPFIDRGEFEQIMKLD